MRMTDEKASRFSSRFAAALLAALTPLALAGGALGQCDPVDLGKLLASDGEDLDQFGFAVAIDGDLAVVGARRHHSPLTEAGAVYVFERDTNDPDLWVEVKTIVPFDSAVRDEFGSALALDNETLIVGAPKADHACPEDLHCNSGAAYIFARNAGGNDNWGLVRRLLADDMAPGDKFGQFVDLHGDIAVVGVPFDSHDKGVEGSAYVFQQDYDGIGSWGLARKLTAPNAADGDQFGAAVAVHGETIVVGAPRSDLDDVENAGRVFVFGRFEGGDDVWGLAQVIAAEDADEDDEFGRTLAIDAGQMLIGSPLNDEATFDGGAIYICEQSEALWTQVDKMTANAPGSGDYFGSSIDLEGGLAVVGAFGNDDFGSESGSIHLFRLDEENQWNEEEVLHSGESGGSRFGWSVGISAHVVIGGAYRDDEIGFEAGAAYLIDTNPEFCPCPGDVVQDEVVDTADVIAMLGAWGACDGCSQDVNEDGFVDVTDLLQLLSNWGPCPQPIPEEDDEAEAWGAESASPAGSRTTFASAGGSRATSR